MAGWGGVCQTRAQSQRPSIPLARLNRKVAGGSCGWWGWCLKDTGSHGGTSIIEDFPHAFHREDKTELRQKPESEGPQASDTSKGRLAGLTQGRARARVGPAPWCTAGLLRQTSPHGSSETMRVRVLVKPRCGDTGQPEGGRGREAG